MGQAQGGDLGQVAGQAVPAQPGHGLLDGGHLGHGRGHAAAQVGVVGIGQPDRLAHLPPDAAVLPGR